MDVQLVPLSKLKPAPYNPREKVPPASTLAQSFRKSLKKFGLVTPLVWNKRSGHIVGGHWRSEMAKELPELLEGDKIYVSVVDLNDEDEQELNVALNKFGRDVSWDWRKLGDLLQRFREPELAGFHLTEVGDVLRTPEMTGADLSPTAEKEANKKGTRKVVRYTEEHFGFFPISVWDSVANSESAIYPYVLEKLAKKSRGKSWGMKKYSMIPLNRVERIVRFWTQPKDLILQLCSGWGEFAATCQFYGRKAIALDVWDVSLRQTRKLFRNVPARKDRAACQVEADARVLPFGRETFDFAYCDPPFWNLEAYGGIDIGKASTYEEWLEEMRPLMTEAYRVLKEESFFIVQVGDFRKGAGLVNVHGHMIQVGQDCGFILHDLVVVRVRSEVVRFWHNSGLKRKYTAKCHEYLVVFRKPKAN